jgi:hypothetical protein
MNWAPDCYVENWVHDWGLFASEMGGYGGSVQNLCFHADMEDAYLFLPFGESLD